MPSETPPSSALSFVPFTTFVDPLFWSEVNRRKVNEWQLDCAPQPLQATYSCSGRQQPCVISITHDSLDPAQPSSTTAATSTSNEHHVRGWLLLANTKKEFVEDTDRKGILADAASKLWKAIASGEWLNDPNNSLQCFYLTAWADIKHFTYSFWNLFPALLYPNQLELDAPAEDCSDELFQLASASFYADQPFLIVGGVGRELRFLREIDDQDVILVFHNPSHVPRQPGWPLRNLLAAVAYLRRDWSSIKVLALRRRSPISESFIMHVKWSPTAPPTVTPKAIGWERDSRDQLTYRSVDLKPMFDPLSIMEQSVDLNLKLIRWRQAPDIQLERFTSLRVLMLGSGTLSCNIARCLLGWGVRHFTFIDHAQLAYNNPIRQSLFTFDDCCSTAGVGGDKNKANVSAAALRRIYPLVDAEGIDMKVPMPGHPYSDKDKDAVREECTRLDGLVKRSDVLFLVMDSRESRWLPTLLAGAHNKLAITVALGFDNYVVMRHGSRPVVSGSHDTPSPSPMADTVPASELGCYFCSDVTAPGNSLADRTLDQQCTISRSGLSAIASGMAVELMAALLQHPLGAEAPARLGEVDESAGLLGGTPHQIRGFISRFHTMTPTVRRFQRCSACGHAVRERYASDGFEFLHRVFQQPGELERVSGLLELQQQAEEFELDALEIEDDSS